MTRNALVEGILIERKNNDEDSTSQWTATCAR